MMTSIILAEPEAMKRTALKKRLDAQLPDDFDEKGKIIEAVTLHEVFLSAESFPTSVVVMDFDAENLTGLQWLLALVKSPRIQQVLLVNSDVTPQLACALLSHGVKGHLHREDVGLLGQAVLALEAGCHYFSPRMSQPLLDWALNYHNYFLRTLPVSDSFLLYFLGESTPLEALAFVFNVDRRTLQRRLRKLRSKILVRNIKELRVFSGSNLFKNSPWYRENCHLSKKN